MRRAEMRMMRETGKKLKNKVIRAAIVFLAAFSVAAVVELISGAQIASSGKGEGLSFISEETAFDEDGKGPVTEVGGLSGDRISFELSGGVLRDGVFYPVGSQSMSLRIGVKYEGDRDFTYITDEQPAYLTEETIPIDGDRRVEAVSIDALAAPSGEEERDADFSALFIDRAYFGYYEGTNPYRALFVFSTVFLLLWLSLFSNYAAAKPHVTFLVICLVTGSVLAISLPPNKVGNDEETHLQAVMDIAAFPSELHVSDAIMNQLMVTDLNNPEAQPGSIEEMESYVQIMEEAGNYKSGNRNPDFYTPKNRVPAYLASAFGVKLAKGLGLSWPSVMLVGRLMNLLMYGVLMATAIKRLPCGKLLMIVIGLFPQNLFLAATFSYDPFITACLSLGFACLMEELLNPQREINMRTQTVMALSFSAGCVVKAVYAPLILTALLMPRGKFNKKTSQICYRAFILLLFVLLISSFILPTVVAPSETGDLRGGDTSEVSQIGFILGAPLSYALILLRQMISWIPQCFIGPDCTTFMGHIVDGNSAFKGYYQAVFLILTVSVLSDRRSAAKTVLSEGQKLWIFLMAGAACVLIWTSMYVAFTEPGAEEIAGVQGRYFIPLIFPLYLLLNQRKKLLPTAMASGIETEGAILARKNDICYYLITVCAAAVGAASVWSSVVSRFCL